MKPTDPQPAAGSRVALPVSSERHERRPYGRRGVVAVIFVAALITVATLVLWVFQSSAVSARGMLGHLSTTNAFYAAESGVEFALYELKNGSDLDGDGTIGAISNDGNSANDPGLGVGTFHVSYSSSILTSTATYQSHVRVVEATLQ